MRKTSVLACLALAACSSASSRMKYSAPTAPPGPDLAKAIFYRTPAYGGSKSKWEVWDDDRLTGFAENGGYFEYLCAPGPRLFHLMGGDFLGEGSALDADLEGGRTYFFRVEVGVGLVAPPKGTPEERRKRDEDFGRCDCRELRPEKVTEERVGGWREQARKHVEELRGPRAAQVTKVTRNYGE